MTKQDAGDAAYAPAPGSHAGRVILVTGASDGIGQALALALARQGATVGLLGRTQRKLARTYDRIVEAGGPKPALLPFNLETAAAPEYDAACTTRSSASSGAWTGSRTSPASWATSVRSISTTCPPGARCCTST